MELELEREDSRERLPLHTVHTSKYVHGTDEPKRNERCMQEVHRRQSAPTHPHVFSH